MTDWFDSEFGAGVVTGVGVVGLLLGLIGGMENRWNLLPYRRLPL